MINYYFDNKNKEKCIVFVHGWGVDSSSLFPLIDTIKKDYSYLYLDLSGFGKSTLEKEYTLDDYCYELNSIIQKENIKNIYGIGHSFGGKVLLRYSELFDLEGLLLISPSIYKRKFNLIRLLKIYLYKSLKRFKIHIPRTLKGSKDYLNSTGLLRKTFLNVCSYYFNKRRLKINKTKIIIVGFNDDLEVKRDQLIKANKYLPNSELYIYDGNHFGYLNKTKEIRVIISYLVEE